MVLFKIAELGLPVSNEFSVFLCLVPRPQYFAAVNRFLGHVDERSRILQKSLSFEENILRPVPREKAEKVYLIDGDDLG